MNQDNVEQQTVLKEQTLSLQKLVPLKRSTRERRSAIPDDYIIFLQKYEDDID